MPLIDRAKLTALLSNLLPSVVAESAKMKESLLVVHDTMDANWNEAKDHKTAAELDHPNGSVTTQKLANGAVTNQKMAANSVATDNIVDGSVTAGKMAASSVGTANIIDRSVTGVKIAQKSILAEHIGTGATSETINGARLDAVEDELSDHLADTVTAHGINTKASLNGDVTQSFKTKDLGFNGFYLRSKSTPAMGQSAASFLVDCSGVPVTGASDSLFIRLYVFAAGNDRQSKAEYFIGRDGFGGINIKEIFSERIDQFGPTISVTYSTSTKKISVNFSAHTGGGHVGRMFLVTNKEAVVFE
jgi:hypothetical protein